MAAQLPPGTSLRGYAEDCAASVFARTVLQAIADANLTRTDVAHALGVTPSYVSQLLNGSANMTVKTLGALLWACGRKAALLRTLPTEAHE